MSIKNEKSSLLANIPQDTQVLCLLGFSFPAIEEELSCWLSTKEKSVIFFHQQPFMENRPNIDFIFCDKSGCDLSFLKEVFLEKIFMKFHYEINPLLEKEEIVWLEEIMDHAMLLEWNIHLQASDVQDFGVNIIRNIRTNYSKGIRGNHFCLLKNRLKGLPAFICGAGASLRDSVSSLKEHKNKAVLFAGGSALSVLTELQVPISVAAAIDPHSFHERSRLQGSFQSPFFFQSRCSPALVDSMQGPLFQVPSQSTFPLEDFFAESGYVDGGPTVTTFSTSLAIHLGCNPIIFIGMDLSYEDENSKYISSKGSQNTFWNGVVYEEKLTQKDWVIAAKWLEDKVKSLKGIRFYTVSPNGLSLKGISHVTWEDLLTKELVSPYDIQGKVHSVFSLEIEKETLENPWVKLEKSMNRCLQIVDRLIAFFQEYYPENPSSKGAFILELFTLYEEIVYVNLLEPLWNIWQFPLERQFQDSYALQLNQWLFFKKVLQEHLSSEELCN